MIALAGCRAEIIVIDFRVSAVMAELADALDLGSSGRPCRFKSCWPHIKRMLSDSAFSFFVKIQLQNAFPEGTIEA